MSRQARHDNLSPFLSSRAQPQAESRDLTYQMDRFKPGGFSLLPLGKECKHSLCSLTLNVIHSLRPVEMTGRGCAFRSKRQWRRMSAQMTGKGAAPWKWWGVLRLQLRSNDREGPGCDVESGSAAATEGTVDPVRGCIPVPYAPPGLILRIII